MARQNFGDLLAFVNVVREGSFTRAAAAMNVTPSALSHTITGMEKRLGVRLLSRSTRKITTTPAGQQLYANVAPRFVQIDAEVAAVREYRDRPAGTIRITSTEHAANTVLWPSLAPVLKEHPDINVEISVDYALVDIVSQRFDAGVRLGDQVARDMIAVRIGPNLRIAVVGTPGYFATHPKPGKPQDLTAHNCINLRLPTHGGLLPWDFEKKKQQVNVRASGQWTFNSAIPILQAALAGCGLAFIPQDMAMEHIAAGRLVRVLDDWCQPYPGYHLYYPDRRHPSRAMSVIVDALRYRPPPQRKR